MLSLIQRALAAFCPKQKPEHIDVGFSDPEAARQHVQARAAFIKASCRELGLPPHGIPADLRGAGYQAFVDFMCNDYDPDRMTGEVTAIQNFICGQAASELRREG